jgi:hypothetical protein
VWTGTRPGLLVPLLSATADQWARALGPSSGPWGCGSSRTALSAACRSRYCSIRSRSREGRAAPGPRAPAGTRGARSRGRSAAPLAPGLLRCLDETAGFRSSVPLPARPSRARATLAGTPLEGTEVSGARAPTAGEVAYSRDLGCLLRLGGDRRGEHTDQRGQQEAAAVHHSMT